MSVNRHQPHVYVLPEDRANSALANGFHLALDRGARKFQVLPEAGGWTQVVDSFKDQVADMKRFPGRNMVLLLDFDEDRGRMGKVRAKIPVDLAERVYILGARSNPEALVRAGLGTLEEIGRALARECREQTDEVWSHYLLEHNAGELERLRQHVRSILFPDP